MRKSVLITMALLMWRSAAPAQTNNFTPPVTEGADGDTSKTGVIGSTAGLKTPDYAPLTRSERLRLYVLSAFGPGAILRASAVAGISQWENKPKEWRGGAEAYGERFGSAFAEHLIRKTLEQGAAAVLHEDTRYMKSTETGFFKRAKHVVVSEFTVRNQAGGEHFAFSRIGAAAGASFISRAWQPPSETTAGDGAVNFGVNIGAQIGWNFVKEFAPHRKGR